MPPAVQLFFCPEFQRPFPLSLFFIHRKTAIAAYIIYRLRVLPVIGSALGPDLGWTIADTLNGLMAIPGFAALFALSPVVFKLTREYFAKADKEKK